MIIDMILDRRELEAFGGEYGEYDPRSFYLRALNYGNVGDEITRAMDYGTEADVKAALCAYIIDNEYNPAICDYINSREWLTPSPAKNSPRKVSKPRCR